MKRTRKDIDREVLKPRAAIWAGDANTSLSEDELARLIGYLGDVPIPDEAILHGSIQNIFGELVTDIEREQFEVVDGSLVEAPKPSTRIERDVTRLLAALEKLERAFEQIDPVTETWLDQALEEHGVRAQDDRPINFRAVKNEFYKTVDLFAGVGRAAEDITTSGPNNAAKKKMIESFASIWERLHGKPPTTDKGRGLTEDPFLELCQEVASIAQTRFKERGVGIGTIQLSGLVAGVLKRRRSPS